MEENSILPPPPPPSTKLKQVLVFVIGWFMFVGTLLLAVILGGLITANIIDGNPIANDKDFVEYALERFKATHNYTDGYQCQEFSRDFSIVLKILEIPHTTKIGFTKNASEPGHSWTQVCLDADATKGTFDYSISNRFPVDTKIVYENH